MRKDFLLDNKSIKQTNKQTDNMNNININQQVLPVSILQISDGKREGEATSITLSYAH